MSAQYVDLGNGKWIKTENLKAEVIIVANMQEELSRINARLAEIPADLTDEELLAWAKLNYPAMDYSRERVSLQERKNEIEVDLSNTES